MTTEVLKKSNPLNLFEIRRLAFLPSSFEYIDIPMQYNLEKAIDTWINSHLKGRYYIGTNITLDDSNQYARVTRVGFEESKELSYFTLACPHLKYK
jgi:hypothetical protein